MTFKISLPALTPLLAPALATALAGPVMAQTLRPVTLVAGASTLNIAYPNDTLPQTLGYWAEEGLDVEVLTTGGTLQAIQQLVAGGAQFAEGNVGAFLQGIANTQLPLRVLVAYGVTDWQFVVPAGSEIQDAATLEGHRVGMVSLATGGLPLMRSYLAEAGIDPDSVEVIPVGFGAAPVEALRNGEVDALLYWGSAVAAFENAGLEMETFAPEAWTQRPDYVLGTTRAAYEADPEAAIGMARGMARAMLFAETNPECALQLQWREYPDSRAQGPDEDTSVAWDLNILNAKLDALRMTRALSDDMFGRVDAPYWEALQAYLVETAQIPAPVAPEDFLVTEAGFFEAVNDFDHDAVIAQAMACDF
ncbi:ABC transporter substrate-binding protein [Pararhodobacter sp. CCB-MM2]|uniref:ABC transporter substrate-binding protein n=1 Tax=Pararhodobacter sp. CCB-MM2 TaxID=1786003 RepID=UPI0008303D33|nr:ABC transporter substrate-binding protein [Pararhodobacter sp. CCB-MM2]